MIGGFQRPLTGAQHLADIAVLHVVVVAQKEDGALHLGQPCDGLLQLCLRLVAVELVVGHQQVDHPTLFVVDAGSHLVFLPA